jgi:hypothetical protein
MRFAASVAIVLASSVFWFAGCAVSSDDDGGDPSTEISESDLKATSRQFVGNYVASGDVGAKQFASLDLRKDGSFRAARDADGVVNCKKAPCTLPMEGTWTTTLGPKGFVLALSAEEGDLPELFQATVLLPKTPNASPLLSLKQGKSAQILRKVAPPVLAEEGERCGGAVTGGQPMVECAAGLECEKLDVTFPGKCVKSTPKPGTEGGMCGGFAGITCNAGLACTGMANHPDAAGKCVKSKPKPGDEGGMCGGFAGFVCKAGLRCTGKANHPDAAGICKK